MNGLTKIINNAIEKKNKLFGTSYLNAAIQRRKKIEKRIQMCQNRKFCLMSESIIKYISTQHTAQMSLTHPHYSLSIHLLL